MKNTISCLKIKYLAMAFILSIVSVFYSYYMQFIQKQSPCILCLVERYIFVFLSILLLTMLLGSFVFKGVRFKLISVFIVTGTVILGCMVCVHHYILQSNFGNNHTVSCALPLGIYYQQNSLWQFLKHVLYDNVECAHLVICLVLTFYF